MTRADAIENWIRGRGHGPVGVETAPTLGPMTHELQTYGLILLFGLVAIEGCGVPLPGETALATAGVLAADGRMSIVAVIAVAAAAAIIGDNTGYWIARLGGRALLARIPLVREAVPRFLPRSERFFERYGSKAVLIARFFAGFRITAAWLAGLSRMPWRRFVVFNATGGILWSLFVGLVAYEFGRAAETAVARYGLYAALVIVVVAVVAFGAHRVRRGRAASFKRSRHG
jgi:membrane protein DedA with SNARE-associated domain